MNPINDATLPQDYPVARILKSHGVKGEMKIEPLTPYFALCDWTRGCRIVDRFARVTERQLTGIETRGQSFYIRLEGVNNKTDSDALIGAMIMLPRDQLPKLPEGEYYVFELKGLKVFDTEGQQLGILTDVRIGTEYDWYEVTLDFNGERHLVPAVADLIPQMDVAGGRMVVRVVPGLFGYSSDTQDSENPSTRHADF